MGIGRALRLVRESERLGVPVRGSASSPTPVIRSPFTDNQLTAIVWNDLLDDVQFPVTRAEAMAVPSVARSRHILCGFGARARLTAYRADVEVPDPPAWTYRTDSVTMLPPFHRMLWTLDDLMFSGWSLWAVARGSDSDGEHVIDAARVPIDWWEFDDDGNVQIGDHDIPWRDVILIPGPHEGILNFGAAAVRHASRLMRAATISAETPIPNIELHDEGDIPLTETERDLLISKWAAARRGADGGVAYTSKGLKAIPHGQRDPHLLIDGRNAAAVEIARICSLPAAMIDATLDKGSLTYETVQGRNGELIDYGVQLYLDAVAARLSMDDVVPRGQRIGFDLEAITAAAVPAATPTTED